MFVGFPSGSTCTNRLLSKPANQERIKFISDDSFDFQPNLGKVEKQTMLKTSGSEIRFDNGMGVSITALRHFIRTRQLV